MHIPDIPFDGFALIFVIVVNLTLAAVILLRNAKARVNILYGILVAVDILWSAANYSTNHVHSHGIQLLTNRLSFIAGLLLVVSVWLMSSYFPRKVTHYKGQRRAAYSVIILNIALISSPWVIKNVTYQASRQVTAVTTGPLYLVYIASILIFMLFVVINFKESFSRSQGLSRLQVIYTAGGVFITAAWILLTTAVIPPLTNDWALSKIGDLGTIIFVAATGYAIIRHRLFDVGLVVARSLAYLFSIATLGIVFTLLTFGLTSLFFSDTNPNTFGIRLSYAAIALILAFVFMPLKKFFDKMTNRFFYQDAYDAQVFLSQFNRTLVTSYQLAPLLRKAAEIISQNLKPEFSVFGIKETKTTGRRIIGNKDSLHFAEKDISFVRNLTPSMHSRLIVTDQLGDKHEALKRVLQSNDIAVIARLTPAVREEGLGYLLLGTKKSGNLYSGQDLKVIEIISNELVIAIQNIMRFEEIERFNATLQGRVEEATRKLRRTNEKLKELDETKDDFISMASHQLRTPLTSIKGYLSMILEEDAGKINRMQREMLGQAFFSSQQMVYLIADLLNVSRLKAGKFIIEPTRINLSTMVQQELEQLEETASARSLTLQYDKPTTFPDLMMDETKISQVIMNFVDNAIYYTPAGGHIILRLINKPDTIELRVDDDGIGVPKSEQPHLFTKFYRAGNARKARPDGTGLGLFMAKKVIIAQGGATLFHSQEGKGSTFGFIFPKARLSVATEAAEHKPITVAQEPISSK